MVDILKGIVALLPFTLLIVWLIKGILHHAKYDKLCANGIKTTATVTDIKLGGKALGNKFHPAVKLYVTLKNEKGECCSAKIETTIATTHMPRFQAGATVDVAYDPADPAKAALLTPTK